MPRTNLKRFYEIAGIESADTGYSVVLDGRCINTPGGNPLIVPNRALATAVAEEWAAQEGTISPEAMPMTGFCCTTLDTVAGGRAAINQQIMKFAESDLLCYRADTPDDLRTLQQEQWQPLLDWAGEAYGACLAVTAGVLPVVQASGALEKLQKAVEALDAWHVTVLASVTKAAGSIVIGLAFISDRLNADEAFAISQVDETWQNSRWGEDSDDARRRAALLNEIRDASRFLNLVRDREGP